jgi:hypothetical protein
MKTPLVPNGIEIAAPEKKVNQRRLIEHLPTTERNPPYANSVALHDFPKQQAQ